MNKLYLLFVSVSALLLTSCGAKTYIVDLTCVPELNDNPNYTAHESLIRQYGPFKEMILRGNSNEEITMHLFVNDYGIIENTRYKFKIEHKVSSPRNGEVYVSEKIISIHKDNEIIYKINENNKPREAWMPYKKERYLKDYSWLYD